MDKHTYPINREIRLLGQNRDLASVPLLTDTLNSSESARPAANNQHSLGGARGARQPWRPLPSLERFLGAADIDPVVLDRHLESVDAIERGCVLDVAARRVETGAVPGAGLAAVHDGRGGVCTMGR